jgi:hypothetical protein
LASLAISTQPCSVCLLRGEDDAWQLAACRQLGEVEVRSGRLDLAVGIAGQLLAYGIGAVEGLAVLVDLDNIIPFRSIAGPEQRSSYLGAQPRIRNNIGPPDRCKDEPRIVAAGATRRLRRRRISREWPGCG